MRWEDSESTYGEPERRRGPQGERGPSGGEAIEQVLSAPLRGVKEFVSGDEDIWYERPEWMPHEAWAATQVAGDLLLDPLNAVGAPLSKGRQAMKGAVASLDNYIPGHYGPTKPRPEGSSWTPEGWALKEKAVHGGSWLANQVKDTAAHLLNPESRALYNEQQITRPAQSRIAKRDPSDTRGTEKNVSQIQYTSGHIPQQTGGTASKNPAAAEVINRSNIEGYAPATAENITESLQRHSVKRYDGDKPKPTAKDFKESEDIYTTPEEAQVVAENVFSKFPQVKEFVLKSPVAKETGGHFNDVVYKNPAKQALVSGFKKFIDEDGTVDLNQLKDYLSDNKDKFHEQLKSAGRKKDTWKLGRMTEDGLWLHGTKVGSAITEGGVGWVSKIEPDGTMKTWMLDQHDFKEKVPGVNRIVPNDLVAITPTMTTNIKNLAPGKVLTANLRRNGAEVKDGRKKVKVDYTAPKYKQTPPNRGTDQTYQSLFQDYAKANPTQAGSRREAAALAGEGLLLQRGYANTREEE